MKLHNGLDVQHLLKMLGNTLIKEQEQWKPVQYKSQTGATEVGGIHRDEAVSWLISLNSQFRFTPETVALSVSMTDRFLSTVKVRPKYIQCVAISCFYIAAKTLEEDEVIPSTVDVVKMSRCGCSVSDILRMEVIILDKLKWSVKNVTSIDLLHVIHSLLMCYYPQLLEGVTNMTPSKQLSVLTRNIFYCVCNHKVVKFRPITLTLAIISLELEQITPAWLPIISTVQKMASIETDSLIHCREIASHLLREKKAFPTVYQITGRASTSMSHSKSFKRKAEQVDLGDDVYDGIKRLYSEEPMAGLVMSCGKEVGLDADGASSSTAYAQVQPVGAN